MKSTKYLFLMSLMLLPAFSLKAQSVKVTVKNPTQRLRAELVEVDVNELSRKMGSARPEYWSVNDAAGKEVPCQWTYDNYFIFPVSIAAGGAQTFTVKVGQPKAYPHVVFQKRYPVRVDDVAWENDCIAYRTYGPALQATGERAFGFDIWVKRTDALVVDGRYDREYNPATVARLRQLRKTNPAAAKAFNDSISYHNDHGNGMDCYKVGPTLGCGTPAILDGKGQIVYPYCYKNYEVMDNGPLRVTFRLDYDTTDVAGVGKVQETRYISLDKGSQLNRCFVRYSGLKNKATMAVGLVVHHEDTVSGKINKQAGYMSYVDPTDNVNNGNGRIFVGVVFPGTVQSMEIRPFSQQESKTLRSGDYGHVLTLERCVPGHYVKYYWGAAWSKFNIKTETEWTKYLSDYADNLRHPLKVSIQ